MSLLDCFALICVRCICFWRRNPLNMLLGLVALRRVALGLKIEEPVSPKVELWRLGLVILVAPVEVRGQITR